MTHKKIKKKLRKSEINTWRWR